MSTQQHSLPHQALPIKELHSIRHEVIPDDVFSSREPIILRGLVSEWPLVKEANESSFQLIDQLQSCYAGQPAPVYFGQDLGARRLGYNEDVSALNFSIRRANLADVLNELAKTLEQEKQDENDSYRLPVRYIASNIIDYYFPGLRDKNDLNFNSQHFEQNPLEGADPMAGIWIGNQTVSPCHFDAQNNIACCIAGRREFTLFPPCQIENLYPGPLDLNPGGQAITMVDFDNPDFARYPKFEQALKHRRVAVLEPGDALFIPVMWWHQVASLSPFNVLINYWWNSFPKAQGQAMSVLEHALLSLKGRDREEKQAWKAIFDYYIFDDMDKAVDHLPKHAHGSLGELDDNTARKLRSLVISKLNK